MINLIACVTSIKNRLAIGKDNGLLFRLKDDMHFFRTITTTNLSTDSKLNTNIVLMGRKTFFSIPSNFRPLKNRLNFILTKDTQLLKMYPVPKDLNFINIKEGAFFMSMDTFIKIYIKYNPNVYVIGGGEIYNYFLDKNTPSILTPSKLYITEVKGYIYSDEGQYTFMDNFDWRYKLVGYSEKYTIEEENSLSYRILYYNYYPDKTPNEYNYIDLASNILINGKERVDRTGVGTISLFGGTMRFDISNGTIPLLTTKRVAFKAIVEELLWMMSGCTDAKVLDKKGVKIWNGNTSRTFLDNRGLHHYDEGILGAGYGFQIRHQGAKYSQQFANTYQVDTSKIGGFDQLDYVEKLLDTDPFSRRIMMCYWNPSDFDKTSLLPCHYSIQFYVEEINGIRYLSGLFNMRSNDFFLGNPFNIAFYTLLVQILALRHNMKAKELVFSGGDIHIYKNHIDAIKKQLGRTPRCFPKVVLNPELKNKDWINMTFKDDFELVGYFPHPGISAPMAV
jgi:dihydrofolate reductase/thymidylate synthase